MVVAGAECCLAVAGEEHFDMAKLFILGDDPGATLLKFVRDLRGCPPP